MDVQERKLRQEYADLKKKLEDPAIYSSKEYPALARRQGQLESLISLFDRKKGLSAQLKEAKSMSAEPELAELAAEEIKNLQLKLTEVKEELDEAMLAKDPNDERNAIVEIRAAAGGDEASLFAGDLYRMYSRWCERHGYKTELLNESPSEGGGFKEIIFMVHGAPNQTVRGSENAYKMLKYEAGVHRVQRVPATESQGR